MRHTMKKIFYAAAIAGLTVNSAQASCSSAFCSISTGAEVSGELDALRKRLDIRYEFIDQNQQRHGRDEVSRKLNSDGELEERSINRNLIATLDYPVTEHWAWTLQLPLVSRSHSHDLFVAHARPHRVQPLHGAIEPEAWEITEIGDVRVTGRYLLSEPQLGAANAGVKFGVKLPTGDFKVTNSQDEQAERSLQPGTGTTDLLLGVFYTHPLAGSRSNWFAEGLWQKPLAKREDYQPGQRLTFDLGVRHTLSDRLRAMLQLNSQWRGRDRGDAANPSDTGGTFVYLSPGLDYSLTKGMEVYGFFQQPLYQRVNGVQLTADWSAALGVAYRF
ncbi:MAG: transporter [Gammaproteobacteria bacterium]